MRRKSFLIRARVRGSMARQGLSNSIAGEYGAMLRSTLIHSASGAFVPTSATMNCSV
jgi:hypothetical protein